MVVHCAISDSYSSHIYADIKAVTLGSVSLPWLLLLGVCNPLWFHSVSLCEAGAESTAKVISAWKESHLRRETEEKVLCKVEESASASPDKAQEILLPVFFSRAARRGLSLAQSGETQFARECVDQQIVHVDDVGWRHSIVTWTGGSEMEQSDGAAEVTEATLIQAYAWNRAGEGKTLAVSASRRRAMEKIQSGCQQLLQCQGDSSCLFAALRH